MANPKPPPQTSSRPSPRLQQASVNQQRSCPSCGTVFIAAVSACPNCASKSTKAEPGEMVTKVVSNDNDLIK